MKEHEDIYYIKLQGKANIPKALNIGHNFRITSDCSIVSEQRSDNEDGTLSVTYLAKPITVEIERDNGEIVKAKDTRSNSQKIRNSLWKHYYDEGIVEDFQKVYDAFTIEVIMLIPHLLREAVKRLNR